MANLYFYYGAMGSSKTANALMVRYNYEQIGKKCLMTKPRIDNRDGERTIKSRIGLKWDKCYFMDELENYPIHWFENYDCVIVDEAQFLNKNDVVFLTKIVDDMNIPVMCYGLRADFKGELFEGSKALFELADSIREIKTVCPCGKKAIMNARWEWDFDSQLMMNNENAGIIKEKRIKRIVKDGEKICLGGNEKYIGLCRKCWNKGFVLDDEDRKDKDGKEEDRENIIM